MSKTPEYTKRAIDKYQKSKDRLVILAPKGTKERITATGESVNAFVNRAIEKELSK